MSKNNQNFEETVFLEEEIDENYEPTEEGLYILLNKFIK